MLLKDRWKILKISKYLTELTDIAGRSLQQGKERKPRFGAGRMEPEKEKNPKQENEELLEQSHENDSHQVEPEKEKNLQQENVDEEVEEYVDKSAFNGKLFTRQFKPTNSNDILTTGEKYKPKIRVRVQEYTNQGIRFYLVYGKI